MKKQTFPRGVHPPEAKTATRERPIDRLPPPERVVIPLLQHFGSPARPLVSKGQEVSQGEMLGEATGLFSAHVHSSVSGKVLAVEEHGHSGGYPVPAVVIANDAQDRLASGSGGVADAFSLSPDEIRQKVKAAAVVGLGGAAFPTAVKLSPPKDKPIDILIVNGCECEPMLTADYRLMLEHPGPILKGAELARLAVGAQKTIIGIEDNKRDAAEVLRRESDHLPAEIRLL